jgi:hypothetical protein
MEAVAGRGSSFPWHLGALAAVVVAAFVGYALLARGMDAPRAFSDELLYFEVGASIADGNGETIRGEEYQHARLYTLVLGGLFRVVPDRVDAYEAAKLLNALLFALAAVPFYLLARRLLAPWSSVALAGLAVAVPSAVYVSLVMTESIAYLAFAWALYAIVLALERPTIWRQLAVLLAIVIAAAARTEFIALFGAYVAGLLIVTFMVPGRWVRPARLLRTLLPTVVATLAGVVAFVAVPAIEGDPPSALGGYSTLWRSYDAGEVAHWLVYHLANLELYLAVVPLAVAPIVLAAVYRRARAGSERDAAFLALFVTANAALLLIVAAFNSTIWAGDRLHDRPLFYVFPLWLVLLFVWISDGAPRPLAAAAFGAGAALLLPLFIPWSEFSRQEPVSQLNGVGTVLWMEVDDAVSGAGLSGLAVALALVLLLVLAALLLPPRFRHGFALVVLAIFVVSGALAWNGAQEVATGWGAALPTEERSWLDDRGLPAGSVTLITRIRPCSAEDVTRAPYLTDFFDDAVGPVAHLATSPDLLPSEGDARVTRSGRIMVDGAPLRAEYAVAPASLPLAGRRLGHASTVPLVLWRVSNPVRVLGRRHASGICP